MHFLHYFFKKDKNTGEAEEITVTKFVSSATKEIKSAKLRFVANEIDKQHGRPKIEIPEKVKREVGNHALTFGKSSAIKTFPVKYTKFRFIRTSVNNWKIKCKTRGDSFVFKKSRKTESFGWQPDQKS